MTGFDIIGDIHGCADKLVGLLSHLGYRERHGAFRHPGRQAIFVGDLIDRGRYQIESIEIVRSMVGVGSALAVMGNHEFNAISYATRNPALLDDFMRTHRGKAGVKNRDQHERFLEAVGTGSAKHAEYLDWFRTLPLWLDVEGIRVAHACWHQGSIDALPTDVGEASPLDHEFIVSANTKGTDAHRAVETVLKGPEVALDEDLAFKDKGGHLRTSARIRWWLSGAHTLRDIADIPSTATTPDGDSFPPLPTTPCDAAVAYRYEDPVPIFFGHYWRTGIPMPAGDYAVCVDYSAVHNGRLVAYRWDGEPRPTVDQFRTFPEL